MSEDFLGEDSLGEDVCPGEDDTASVVPTTEDDPIPSSSPAHTDKPDTLSHIERMAFEYHFEDILPGDPLTRDQVQATHLRMLEDGFLKEHKAKPKERSTYEIERLQARIATLKMQRDRLVTTLRRMDRRTLADQATPATASATFPPTPPSSAEPPDSELKMNLKREINILDCEIWRRRHHYSIVDRAHQDFLNDPAAADAPRSHRTSAFKKGRRRTGKSKTLLPRADLAEQRELEPSQQQQPQTEGAAVVFTGPPDCLDESQDPLDEFLDWPEE
ncbi:hypothetical protein EJ07DRAFT_176037 [Lizonia empirigonia]|nr:hypothetical protein EJ07DRAFT_176037 [Lizonia empirigonia]